MGKFRFAIVAIFLIVWLVTSFPRKEQNETLKSYNRNTGEATVTDDLIQKYNIEHQKFHSERNKNGDCLVWPAIDKKNFTIFCTKYLQHSVPAIKNDNVIGTQYEGTLIYEKSHICYTNKIIIVQCKVVRNYTLSYYMTRAPEPNCVYALRNTGNWRVRKFTIIHKHCDFEGKQINLKRKRVEVVAKTHPKTGQPIAKAQYLLEYELEHHQFLQKHEEEGKCIKWPGVILHYNLDSYCYQYMKVCVPNKNRGNVKGSWNIEKFHYKELNKNRNIYVTVIKCCLSFPNRPKYKAIYHITRAPETNCVYALARPHRRDPFVIKFKHCDFEHTSDQQFISQIDTPVIPKSEVKEEMIDSVKTLQLFSND